MRQLTSEAVTLGEDLNSLPDQLFEALYGVKKWDVQRHALKLELLIGAHDQHPSDNLLDAIWEEYEWFSTVACMGVPDVCG